MPVIRTGSRREVLADAAVLLDRELTPQTRLAYAVLLAQATADTEDTWDELAALIGVTNKQLEDLAEQLAAAGAVDFLAHGTNKHRTVSPHHFRQDQRRQTCTRCATCGTCACYTHPEGECDRCRHRAHQLRTAEEDIARWRAELDAGAIYALPTSGTRLHRWDCPTLQSPESRLATLQEQLTIDPDTASWERLPKLLTTEQLRARGSGRRRCATCGPDPVA
ncbi:hypothetical protein ACFU7Y_27410 [Kitasatospora sp. NPDC057542]|uniref:hypothetical protein n=1 Tax=Kitasatospora sp. NPDC057542 TaxID=3346162 RepID=UPI0036C7BD0C